MTEKLKPCPFCRSEQIQALHGFAEFDETPDWAVICMGCGGSGRESENKAEAIAAWNRRALKSETATDE